MAAVSLNAGWRATFCAPSGTPQEVGTGEQSAYYFGSLKRPALSSHNRSLCHYGLGRSGSSLALSRRQAENGVVMVVAVIVSIAPILAVGALILANLRRLSSTRLWEEPPQRLPGPPRMDFGGDGGLAGVRVPRRPLTPTGSAAAAIEEPEPELDDIPEVTSVQVSPEPARGLRAS